MSSLYDPYMLSNVEVEEFGGSSFTHQTQLSSSPRVRKTFPETWMWRNMSTGYVEFCLYCVETLLPMIRF